MSTNAPVSSTSKDVAVESASGFQQSGARDEFVAWIMAHVEPWEKWRKENYDRHWNEYLRKWGGTWTPEDKTRGAERSRLISPALQQAVEEAVAEEEEAILGEKEGWFDLDDDNHDTIKENWQAIRKQVLEDMEFANIPGSIMQALMFGAIYGTLIGKVIPTVVTEQKLKTLFNEKENQIIDGISKSDRVAVEVEPIRPDQFVFDTSVTRPGVEGIRDMLGMAHRLPRPRHTLVAKMQDEERDKDGKIMAPASYYDVPLQSEDTQSVSQALRTDGVRGSDAEEANLVTEYHGLVPRALLDAAVADGGAPASYDSREMVESVVTIVDDKYLLQARANTNLKGDRDIFAAPWDIVPGRFLGRGVGEKGINSQKALDGMLRAMMDGLGYTVHPMLGVDARRRDPRHKIEVGPGKVIYVNGPPSETLMALNFGRTDPTSFTMSGELERLIQTGTGTGGSAAPPRNARGNATLGGMSLVQGGLAKRHKRTLRLVERHFLLPLIEKFTLRHMQYNDAVYPFIDITFRVRVGLSLMAREVENNVLGQLMQTVPPGPVFYMLLSLIVQNTSLKDKDKVAALVDMVLQGQMPGASDEKQPDPVEQERSMADLQEVLARTRLKDATTAEKVVKIKQLGARNGTRKAEPKSE